MSDEFLDSNKDILENIISASENSNFHLMEDIYDSSDKKLLSKGYKIAPKIREKLFDRILKKPIETSIQSENSITSNYLATQALEVIQSNSILNKLTTNVELEAKQLSYLNLEPLASLLLSVIRDTDPKNLKHLLFVTLLARAIGREMKLDEYDMTNLSLACILHDIGQLYATIPSKEKLTEEDWRKVMVHPIIGSSVVKMYMNYPYEVSTAILEHHERCNGNGYPKQINANECSKIGQILILAEAVAGILKTDNEIQNALVVFKMSTSDYPADPLNSFNNIINSSTFVRTEINANFTQDTLKKLIHELYDIPSKIGTFLKDNHDPKVAEVAIHLESRILRLRQSLYATGITHYLEDNHWQETIESQIIRIELELTIKEIGWQIQDIVRDLMLRLIDSHNISPKLTEVTAKLTKEAENIINRMS